MMLYYAKTGSFVFTSILPANAGLAGVPDPRRVRPERRRAAAPRLAPRRLSARRPSKGAVFLCAFTTKTAVYVLARGFSGFEILAIMGTAMTVYGVCYAVIENDIRRLLAYHIISQVGYMVAGVGIGTADGHQRRRAHAFAHILYKALLFMGAGAVLYMTGTAKLTDLGGLYKKMPLDDDLLRRRRRLHLRLPALQRVRQQIDDRRRGPSRGQDLADAASCNLAGIGTFLSVGLKVTYFAFFGKETPERSRPGQGAARRTCSGPWAHLAPLLHHRRLSRSPSTCCCPSRWTTTPTTATTSPRRCRSSPSRGWSSSCWWGSSRPEEKINLDVDWFYRKGADLFLRFDEKVIAAVRHLLGRAVQDPGAQGPVQERGALLRPSTGR